VKINPGYELPEARHHSIVARETGRHFEGARHRLEANFGGWISRDPIAKEGGINLYGYVLNNPISLSDPLGLWALNISAGFGGTFAIDGFGFHAEVNVGISIDFSDPLNSNAFANAQGDAMAGAGGFLGVSGQGGLGISSAPPCPGGSGDPNLHAEGDVGVGEEALGGAIDVAPDDSVSGAFSLHPGVGFGAFAGAGGGVTGTLATPSLGRMLGLR
jgi:RHS repeat-associated protein